MKKVAGRGAKRKRGAKSAPQYYNIEQRTHSLKSDYLNSYFEEMNFLLALFFLFQACLGTKLVLPRSSGGRIRDRAVELARNAGCLLDYQGEVNVQERVISSCFTGGFVTEAIVMPVCSGEHCASVRLRSLARMKFGCDNTPSEITCA